ncbi:MAG: hypothetical protein H6711_06810 [Myxococcales bacterium]|nr:hypothetical protein [Myxococcales bacterium]
MPLAALAATSPPPLSRRLRRRPSARIARALGLASALALGLVGGDAAAGDRPAALREGTRPIYLQVGVGPSFGISRGQCYQGSYYIGPLFDDPLFRGAWGCGGAFKVSQEIGVHFSGRARGPALGLLAQEELLGRGYFGLVLAPKFSWDIQVVKGLGFYISPNVALGYHLAAWRGYRGIHGADIQAGVTSKLVVNDRLLIWAAIPHFDVVLGPRYLIPRYDLMVGAGVTF